jgi:hypothetical protein
MKSVKIQIPIRDQLLIGLLKSPPQPRPHRERGQSQPIKDHVSDASGEKQPPSV